MKNQTKRTKVILSGSEEADLSNSIISYHKALKFKDYYDEDHLEYEDKKDPYGSYEEQVWDYYWLTRL